MGHIFNIVTRFSSVALGVFLGPNFLYAVTLDELFWDTPQQIEFLPYNLIASFSDADYNSFLIESQDKGELIFIAGSDLVEIETVAYRFSRLENNAIFLTGENGLMAKIAASISLDQPFVKELPQITSSSASARPKMAFYAGATTLQNIQALAQRVGLPPALSNTLRALPAPARSLSGRPGWLLNDSLPPAFFAMSMFQRGDIILTVDGISAHDVEDVMNYVQTQDRSKRYQVELERDKRLKMIAVYVDG